MIFLIGGKGLIGSAFVRYFKKKKIKFRLINRKNKKKFFKKRCKFLIDCNGNGSKRIGIENPHLDFEKSVIPVVDNLHKIQFEKYIYISSCQVYQNLSNKKLTKESRVLNTRLQNPYGFNKFVCEQYIQKFAKNYLIFRLPYVIGPGLRRNPFYDIPKFKTCYLKLNSKINFIHTDYIAKIIMKVSNSSNNQILNLGSQDSIKVLNILKKFGVSQKEIRSINPVYDLNNISLNKISKIINLPKTDDQIKVFLKDISWNA